MNSNFNPDNAVAVSDSSQGAKMADSPNFMVEQSNPVDVDSKGNTAWDSFRAPKEDASVAVSDAVSGVQKGQGISNPQSETKPLEKAAKSTVDATKGQPVKESKPYKTVMGPEAGVAPDEGFLNSALHTTEGAAWNMIAKPLFAQDMDPKQAADMDRYLNDLEKKHPIAATIAGTAPYIASAAIFPESLIPNVWGRMAVQFGSVSALSAVGHERVDEAMKPLPTKILEVGKETAKGAAFSPIWAVSSKLNFVGRPFASALARAGIIGTGSATMSTFFGSNITEAYKQGGILGALSLIFEVPSLAGTALGRGIINHANSIHSAMAVKAGLPEVNIEPGSPDIGKQIITVSEGLAKQIPGIDKPHIVAATVKLADGTKIHGTSHESALEKVNLNKPSEIIPERRKESVPDNARKNRLSDWTGVIDLYPTQESKIYHISRLPIDNAMKGRLISHYSDKPIESGFTVLNPDGSRKFITREESMKEPYNLPSGSPEDVKGLSESKFETPPPEIKIVNPETLKQIDNNEGKIDINMVPGVTETAEVLQNSHAELKEKFVPYEVGKEGAHTAEVLRENLGVLARNNDKLEFSLANAKKIFDQANKDSALEFIYRMEEGKDQDSKDLQKIATVLRNLLDTKRDEVIGLGTGKLDNFIENYFPHVWEDPNKVGSVIKRIMGKRPFEGTKSFLKKRTIPTTREGIDLGFTPVSYNPIDSVMLKVREMERYIMAHRTIQALKEEGLIQFVREGEKAPDGFVKIDDRFGEVRYKNDAKETVLAGKYMIQKDAGRILNNYLSPGLSGKSYIYDLYRGAGNTLNQFQLGISAFHLGFTSMDATISKFALGINKLSMGNYAGALKEFSTAPFAPITNILQGRKLLQSWYGKDNGTLTNTIADIMATAGGRAKMDKFYATGIADSMNKSIKEGKLATAAFKVPFYIVEQVARPIMEYIVPRQKLGVFMDMMKMEIENNPNISHEEMRTIAQRAWNSVDNRMGQLVYDNLFWNKTTKDLAMAYVRSLGWNLGTIREIGGGVKDIFGNVNDVIHGKASKVSYRTAYVMALPIVTGLYGAIYQYLHTGQGPQELKDYFFPKNGGIDKKGQAARISLPTYMKDIYHYTTNPVQTVLNKFSPVNNTVIEMLANKDFYGVEIRNMDDSALQQIAEESGFVASQFIPFGFRNQGRDTRTSAGSKIEPFIGITPAPYDINMTAAERQAWEFEKGHIPPGSRTKEQAQHSQDKAKLRSNYMETKDQGPLTKAVTDGMISAKEKKIIVKEAAMTNLQRMTRHLTFEETTHLLKKATPDEKEELGKIIARKKSNKERQGTWTQSEEDLYDKSFNFKQ